MAREGESWGNIKGRRTKGCETNKGWTGMEWNTHNNRCQPQGLNGRVMWRWRWRTLVAAMRVEERQGLDGEDVEKAVLIFDLLIRIAPFKQGIRKWKYRSEFRVPDFPKIRLPFLQIPLLL